MAGLLSAVDAAEAQTDAGLVAVIRSARSALTKLFLLKLQWPSDPSQCPMPMPLHETL